MSINIELLSRLVTWAAEDHVRGTDPERAVALGIAKEGDKRLGRWNQEAWGEAERNGVCQTAFCIAGGAVALDENTMTVMTYTDHERDGKKVYSGIFAVDKSQVTPEMDTSFGYVWLNSDQEVYDIFGDADSVSTKGREILGLTSGQADALFSGSNEIDRVVSLAMDYAREEGKNLDIPVWVAEYYDEDYAAYSQYV